MENIIIEIYDDVEKAIDYAFEGKYVLGFYDYLKIKKVKRIVVEQFLRSPIVIEIENLIQDMEDYLEGGSDCTHKQLREGYGHIPKPQARKIRNYLENIINDAKKYTYDRRPGRRKKTSK